MIIDTKPQKAKALVIAGYSGAGKSTLVNRLESEDWIVASTSRVNHEVTDLSSAYYGQLRTSPERKTYIHNAERILVPCFTRRGFIAGTIIGAIGELDTPALVCESIGGEEYRYCVDTLILLGYQQIIAFNVRHPTEDPGADYRQLIPSDYRGIVGFDVDRNLTTI